MGCGASTAAAASPAPVAKDGTEEAGEAAEGLGAIGEEQSFHTLLVTSSTGGRQTTFAGKGGRGEAAGEAPRRPPVNVLSSPAAPAASAPLRAKPARAALSGMMSLKVGAEDKPRLFTTKLLLLCNNCEDASNEPVVRCVDCSEDGSVVVFCADCDSGLHAPVRMRAHKRLPFSPGSIGQAAVQTPLMSSSSPPPQQQQQQPLSSPPGVPRARSHGLGNGGKVTRTQSLFGTAATGRGARAGSEGSTVIKSRAKAAGFGASARPRSPRSPGPRPFRQRQDFEQVLSRRAAASAGEAYGGALDPLSLDEALRFPEQIVFVACGLNHAAAVTSSGALFMWGANDDGQCGVGDVRAREVASPVRVVVPAAGAAAGAAGTGVPGAGAPGAAAPHRRKHTRGSSLSVAPSPGATLLSVSSLAPPGRGGGRGGASAGARVRHAACGYRHTLAVTEDGRVFSWGCGMLGCLGHGGDADSSEPGEVALPKRYDGAITSERAAFVAASQYHSACVTEVVRGDGGGGGKQPTPSTTIPNQVYVWGAGESGQVGNGEYSPQLAPVAVDPDALDNQSVVSLALGNKHTVAVTETGRVYAWGNNEFGQLGLPGEDDDDDVRHPLPRLVTTLLRARAFAAAAACGERHTTVLTSAGELWSFGSGETHQIGVMDNVDQPVPVRVPLPAAAGPVADVAVGQNATVAVTARGEAFVWGWAVDSAVPRPARGAAGHFLQRAAVGSNEMAVVLTGTTQRIYSWNFDADVDDDDDGPPQPQPTQVSLPRAASRAASRAGSSRAASRMGGGVFGAYPELVPQLRGKAAAAVSCGTAHQAAVTRDGRLLVWGENDACQLGTGQDSPSSPVPRPVVLPAAVRAVACGPEHTVALTADGAVHTWGTGTMGRLGHGDELDGARPRRVAGGALAGKLVEAVAAGPHNSGAVSKAGTVFVWGAGSDGQLGRAGGAPAFAPEAVEALRGRQARSLAFGHKHALCVTRGGELLTWGDNEFGQLGTGADPDGPHAPAQVPPRLLGGEAVADAAAGDMVTIACTASGRVFAWGSGETQQLCQEDAEDRALPVEVAVPRGAGRVVRIATGLLNSCAITDEGRAFVWGWQLGERPFPLPSEDGCRPLKGVADVAVGGGTILVVCDDDAVKATAKASKRSTSTSSSSSLSLGSSAAPKR